jgi:alpha-tubulin suppressor-like RCC1 family protein
MGAGSGHTCVLTAESGVKCWGKNSSGQLGDGTGVNSFAPVDVVGLGGVVAGVAPGGDHTCALTGQGGVKCWGKNASGELGDGTTVGKTAPVDVLGLSSGVTAVAAGGENTCALTTTGGVKCWGRDDWGQLGDGPPPWKTTPVDALGFGP